MKTVPVYSSEYSDAGYDHAIGRVAYNERLDRWDGNNFGNGGTGMHKGISRLTRSGSMVIIIGTQWQGCKDKAFVVSDERALDEIINSGNLDIIDDYPQLKKIYDQQETD